MSLRRELAALSAVGLALGLASCGSSADRPAHRPISVIYVSGAPSGPWADRTEGLADGVKLAVAERNGLIGERAVATVVVPVVQRDGDQVSAAIGAGRILRDSRALAVLATYSAPQLAQAAPQLNGGEIALLQYGSGMRGLLAPEIPGEPGRYQPSGESLAIRGVPADEAVAKAVAAIPGVGGIDSVPRDSAYDKTLSRAAQVELGKAQKAYDAAMAAGTPIDELPSKQLGNTSSFYQGEETDASRLATQIRTRNRGVVRDPQEAAGAQVYVIDPTEADAVENARRVARRTTGLLVLVDAADRPIPASAVAGHAGPVYLVRRTLDAAGTAESLRIRAKERELFGRDRGDAVVAGYRAARRILSLAAAQPDKTIDRSSYAKALVADAPTNADLPVRAGQVLLGSVVVERESGGRWIRFKP